MVSNLLKRFSVEDNMATGNRTAGKYKQGTFMATDYAQQIRTKTVRSAFTLNEKVFEGFFVEGVHRSIYVILRQWQLRVQHVPLKDPAVIGVHEIN